VPDYLDAGAGAGWFTAARILAMSEQVQLVIFDSQEGED
jgi:hypothetical protein